MTRGCCTLGLMALVLAGCRTAPHEPPNLQLAKDELRAYVSSGQYDRGIAAVAAQARVWIEQRAAKRAPGERLAIVCDLDETLLSNWPEIVRQDLGFEQTTFATWMESAKCPAIEPVKELFLEARRLGLDVICLTARAERFRAATEQNLRAVGCGDYAVLICKPNGLKQAATVFKTAQRKRVTDEGRVIVANIGDQESDLAGGYAERTFKLPDPFYFTP